MGDMYGMALGDGMEIVRFRLFAQSLLNIDLPLVGRFRDCWIENVDGRLIVAIYTRNGGGNRPDYEAHSQVLASHPGFLDDADDDFDCTYRTYRFTLPNEVPPHLRDQSGDAAWSQERWTNEALPLVAQYAYEGRRNMSEVWHEAIARFEKGDLTPKQVAWSDQVGAQIKDALNNPPADGPNIIHL